MAYATIEKPLEWFRANPENYRSHPEQQQAVLQESLRRFGIFRNVVARPDGTLLAGHGILAAAQAEGMKSFPCVIFDGTDEEARALMVADNEQQRLAQDDPDQLSQLLESLRSDGLMDVTGHDDESLSALLETVANAAPPTGVPPNEWMNNDPIAGSGLKGLHICCTDADYDFVQQVFAEALSRMQDTPALKGDQETAALLFVCREFVAP